MAKQPKAVRAWGMKFDIVGITVAYTDDLLAKERLKEVRRDSGLRPRLVPVLITPATPKRRSKK